MPDDDTPTRKQFSESLFSAPKQRRSREGLNRVLIAATELLQEVGYEDMQLTEVGRRARVGIGSIYARVGSKHGLLLFVQAKMIDDMKADQKELLDPLQSSALSLDELVFHATAAIGEMFRRHESLLRVFMIRGDFDESVISVASDANFQLAEVFAEVLLQRRAQITHPDPPLAVDVCFRLVYDSLARRILRGPSFESKRPISWDELMSELAVACGSYLLHSQDLAATSTARRNGKTALTAQQ
jgi:AcrR family transcriptional regulator